MKLLLRIAVAFPLIMGHAYSSCCLPSSDDDNFEDCCKPPNIISASDDQDGVDIQEYNQIMKNTIGYKETALKETVLDKDQKSINFSMGSLQITNNPLNFAVMGDGFMPVAVNLLTDTAITYTKKLDTVFDHEGFLCNSDGARLYALPFNTNTSDHVTEDNLKFVLLPKNAASFIISHDGILSAKYSDKTDEPLFRFAVLGSEYLKNGDGLYFNRGENYKLSVSDDTNNYKFFQGMLETSNVTPTRISLTE